jgi:hypothetical protein
MIYNLKEFLKAALTLHKFKHNQSNKNCVNHLVFDIVALRVPD